MRNSSHYIEILFLQSHWLISHLMIHRDLSENRDLWSSRDYFLLIKLSSSSVVTSIWFHQNRILIFVLIDLSTISKISKYERNHLDLNKSFSLNDRKTTRFEINRLMKKLTIRIVSKKQMRFEVESFMHEELNDDVMKQKSVDQIRWSNHLIKKISSRKESSSVRSRFAISSTHLIISNYHDTASSTIFQHYTIQIQIDSVFQVQRQRQQEQQYYYSIIWCVSKLDFMIILLETTLKLNKNHSSKQVHLLRNYTFHVFVLDESHVFRSRKRLISSIILHYFYVTVSQACCEYSVHVFLVV
jgi:hypothetical protein